MALVSLAAHDGLALVFAVNAGITAMFAGACVLTTKGRPFELRFRDAALLTVVAWFVVPLFGALPLMAAPTNLSPLDAYFESVSGLTTTGSTVLIGLDGLPPSILLWRSTLQWIGGIGIVGIAIVILPFLKIGGMQLFRLESSDRSEDVVPRVRSVANSVGRIYLAITAACFLSYWALGMTPFDALNHAFTTVCTGGYSTHDASFSWFASDGLNWASVVFMTAGSLPFLAYVRVFRRGRLRERVDPQVTAYFFIAAVLSAIFALWLVLQPGHGTFSDVTSAVFTVVSIMTTTGFGAGEFAAWGTFATVFIFMVSFVGGCTGSTAGAIKVFRFQIMARVVVQHIRQALHPHLVSPMRYGRRVVTDDEVASVGTFVFLYLLAFVIVSGLVSLTGLDAATAMSATATTLGNVGPGITEAIGPAGNFAHMPEMAKVLLVIAMIVGRLEILGVMILFLPSFYR
jgi:trk system potassium uptake protein